MNFTICNLDSSLFVNSITVPWAVQAIDSFCKEVSDEYLKEVGDIFPASALAYYARDKYDETGNTKTYFFDKECLKEENRDRISGTGNINTFSSWCRRSGLLYDQRGLFGLSELASLLLKPNKITIKEFAFILLSKQWVKIDGECYRDLLSVIDTIAGEGMDFIDLLGQYTQNKNDVKNLLQLRIFESVTGRAKTTGDYIAFTRFDTLRNCLVQAGILSDKNSGFKLTEEGKTVLADFHKHEKRIQSFGNTELGFLEYMCSINNGAFSLIGKDNVAVYKSVYPNLSRLALRYGSNEYDCIPSEIPISPLQQIYFGAPGTGKSYQLDIDAKPYAQIRTIFHPDSDYSSFIGCFKPISVGSQIEYKFRPQAFVNAYIKSWLTKKPFFLIIEEINRGNCAQIFGDIFQLLDRKNGVSDYTIKPDTDLAEYIKSEFEKDSTKKIIEENHLSIPPDIISGESMRLPKNLILRATMNTSDQSLFPMDSAFKRRWNWKYFSIKDEKKGFKIVLDSGEVYDWWETIKTLNDKVFKVTKSADKQLGYWFAKIPENETTITAEDFVSKVVFYLWNDVFKDYSLDSKNAFSHEIQFGDFYDSDGSVKPETIIAFMELNGIKNESADKTELKPEGISE
jgi:hypothetical protein